MNNLGMQPTKGAKGVSGTISYKGIINSEEYLADLSRYNAFIVYDKMRRGDGTIGNILDAIANPLIQADWRVDYGTDDKVGEFIEHELFHGDIEFKAILREMLKTGLPFGFAVFEMIMTMRNYNGQQLIGIGGLESRKQKTIYAWETIEGKAGVTQWVESDKYSIPMEKLLVFTHDKEGTNYEGVSILRRAYKHWLMKDKFYLMDAVKNERQSNGIPYAKGDFNPAEKTEVENVLKSIRANEQAFMVMPASAVEIGFMDMKAGTTVDLMPSIAHHDRQIAKSIQLQFIDIGSNSSSGSFAASNDQKELYDLALEAIADNLAATFQKLINKLVDVNFSNVETYPKLIHSKVGSQDIEKLATALEKFTNAGLLTPDAEIEQTVRKLTHLPEASDDIQKIHETRISNAAKGITTTTTDTGKATKTDVKTDEKLTDDKEKAKTDALKKAHEAKQRLIDIIK